MLILLKSKVKLSMKIPKIDQVIFPTPSKKRGLLYVRYADNQDLCFDGRGKLAAVSIV